MSEPAVPSSEVPPERPRELPEFEALVLGERGHDVALVIPVINEGERIQRQLRELAAAGHPVDVIIADGGSTDGSLEQAFLEETGVRARLTKTGPGRLSAQLRMAYAWCLDEGYRGILTVDGNGKDGLDAIPRFLQTLADGCDLVQGSRYQPGGEAVNTPLDRHIGNRFVHAPLISLAAGVRYTDTTNGFRAYSARLLQDPRVAPFRDVFANYELLFYLSVRAGELGYRVTEVPVRRAYPDAGSTPTKISGLAGRVALVAQLLGAVAGAWRPEGSTLAEEAAGGRRRRFLIRAPGYLLVLVLAAIYALHFEAPRYSTDSWHYHDLARHLQDGRYASAYTGSYAAPAGDDGASAAFPPLWPGLIALVERASNLGARSGFLLAFFAALLWCWTAERAGRALTGTRAVGGIVALFVLGFPPLFAELVGGRTLPLQLALYGALAWLVLAAPPRRLDSALALGGCCALALLNRFDALPVVLVLLVGWPLLGSGWRSAAVAVSAFLVLMTPWSLYSLATTGRLLASDNGWVALATDPDAFVTDWPAGSATTLLDAPGAWFGKIGVHLSELPAALVGVPGQAHAVVLVLLAVFLLRWRLRFALPAGAPAAGMPAPLRDRRVLLVLAALAATAPAYLATGYLDARYFTPWWWWGLLLALALLLGGGRRLLRERLAPALAGTLALLLLLGTALDMAPGREGRGGDFERPAWLLRLDACAEPDGETPVRILFVGGSRHAAQFAAVTGRQALVQPRNLDLADPGAWRRFVEDQRVSHVYQVRAPGIAARYQDVAPLDCNPRLYPARIVAAGSSGTLVAGRP